MPLTCKSQIIQVRNSQRRRTKHDQCAVYAISEAQLKEYLRMNFTEAILLARERPPYLVSFVDDSFWILGYMQMFPWFSHSGPSLQGMGIRSEYNEGLRCHPMGQSLWWQLEQRWDKSSQKTTIEFHCLAHVHLSYSLGYLIGCLMGGFISVSKSPQFPIFILPNFQKDRYGRKPAIYGFSILSTIFGFLLSFSREFEVFLVVRFLLAACNEAADLAGSFKYSNPGHL